MLSDNRNGQAEIVSRFPGHASLPTTYLSRLSAIHRRLRPRTYLELGVCSGRSLVLAMETTDAVGVDPAPELASGLPRHIRMFEQTSDAFFQRDHSSVFNDLPLDLVFIDAMHLFEYVLRDFANAARRLAPGGYIVVHDTLPRDRVMAQRERETQAWTGDVWKLIPCLQQHLPYLSIVTLDTAPTGLSVISGVDPADTTLLDQFEAIVAEFIELDFRAFELRENAAVVDDLRWIDGNIAPIG